MIFLTKLTPSVSNLIDLYFLLCSVLVTRRKLTKKEMIEVQERVAELESEIAQDKFNDELINDDVEKMIQMFLTVIQKHLKLFYYYSFKLFSQLER